MGRYDKKNMTDLNMFLMWLFIIIWLIVIAYNTRRKKVKE